MLKQTTLKGSFSLCGKGLHTGLSLTVTFNPAPENTGYKIQRIDLEGQPIIDALAERVVDTQRGTVLANGDVRVSTVEHGLSALYAMGIDNCLIQVNGPEFPILDGSAIMYVEQIKRVGIEEQSVPKDYYIIRHKIEVKDGKQVRALPSFPTTNLALRRCVLSTRSLSIASLLRLTRLIILKRRSPPRVPSCLCAISNHCLKPISSRVATWTMPSSSTRK